MSKTKTKRAAIMGLAMLLGATLPLRAVDSGNAAKKRPASPTAAETKEQREQRMRWWRDARFGMFIHWGLYAIPGGEWNEQPVKSIGEWIMQNGKIPVAEYEKLAGQFDPVKFDAKQWVKIAGDAGMKYIVITSKHHDGFSLWDSKVSKYDVMDASPFKRDILGELAKACKADGRVRLCFYHSIMDWHHPDAQGLNEPGHYNPGTGYKPNPSFPQYFENYLKPQVKELITRYQPGVLWFDGEWVPEYTEPMSVELYDMCRSLDPKLIVNNRVGKTRAGMHGMSTKAESPGDFGTPEQEIPTTGFPGVDWESCMTMNDTWGYKKADENWKSGATLIRNLIETSSKGGNFLLNVGPTPQGEIPAPSVERLGEVGKWMAVNSESIYDTQASPFKKLAWGRATQKPGKIYLEVYDWPKDGKLRVPLLNKVNKAYLLASKETQDITQATDHSSGVSIKLPAEAPDAVASVVVLEIEGEPHVSYQAK